MGKPEPEGFDSDFTWEPSILQPYVPSSEEELVRIIEADSSGGKELNDEQLKNRCKKLMDSITSTVFQYVRTGLFERDRLTVSSMICFSILEDEKVIDSSLLQNLLLLPTLAEAPAMPDEVKTWLPENVFNRVAALEATLSSSYESYQDLTSSLSLDQDEWDQWYNFSSPENERIPGKIGLAGEIEQLMLLRAMRPDRLSAALKLFVSKKMGEDYVYAPPFDIKTTFAQSCATSPIFFVLFPGVDPTPWVEELGASLNITTANGLFVNISMGQGQEKPAETTLERMASEGGWVLLQNVHLMQSWLPKLEQKLEVLSANADPKFRCFISAEPPPFSYLKNMPESIMQSALKVANELPSDLQSNMRRAFSKFSDQKFAECKKKEEYKACLFGLCFYHSVILGRRRFGTQGWSRSYGFNLGDLTICSNVLLNYLNASGPNVPWEDLRYIFGEIMYGGHITDYWDRRTNNTYLEVLFNSDLLRGGQLAMGFPSPNPREYDYKLYNQHITNGLREEHPHFYGLHPNAEIGYLTSTTTSIFDTILTLRMGSVSKDDNTKNEGVKDVIKDLMDRLPRQFNLGDIEDRSKKVMETESGPFIVVINQECTRMNRLLQAIFASLVELKKGLNGQLNMSQPMEDLNVALSINQVPGRNPFHLCSWEKLAWPSRKSLSTWFLDLIMRVQQMLSWSKTLETPISIWLPGLFNPTAYLTAIKQVTARRAGYPLDKVTIETHITAHTSIDNLPGEFPAQGAYAHGLFMQGGRWAFGEEATDLGAEQTEIDLVPCNGILAEAKLKELLPPMPIIYLRAVKVDPSWSAESCGYIRPNKEIYNCPVYFTTMRGATYVFLSTLNTKEPPSRWVLAGVCLIMQTDE